MHLGCDSFVFHFALEAQLVIQTGSDLRDMLDGLNQIYPQLHKLKPFLFSCYRVTEGRLQAIVSQSFCRLNPNYLLGTGARVKTPRWKAHRDVIRNTWGGESLVLGKVVKLFFLLGLQTGEGSEQLQEQLLQESTEHQDLIQSDFLDCYKNLTIKTMMMLEWLDTYCSGASYAMKIDSDMFLNVPNLINMLSHAPKENYMSGLVVRQAVVLRDRTSKWCLPVELYPHPRYPRYALGLGYVLSLDLPKKLVGASRHVKAVYIEDVYLGLCMEYLGISPTDPPDKSYFNVFPVQYSHCSFSRIIATTTHNYSDLLWIWKDLHRPEQQICPEVQFQN
ncbi:beta-1,3-galactosyltransferase 2 [Lates calcarifer]|uniref:Hexosyltransferase n=1 Tax=Lates calcarifer TaxID=8187 RepID=A0AAJ8BLV9_LATCA|nr:beta-1,3-galactosyltransferase 2 [Lates calcarifer]